MSKKIILTVATSERLKNSTIPPKCYLISAFALGFTAFTLPKLVIKESYNLFTIIKHLTGKEEDIEEEKNRFHAS